LSILEKRVRSRLSKIYIYFNVQLSIDDFKSGFFQLLGCTQITKNIIKVPLNFFGALEGLFSLIFTVNLLPKNNPFLIDLFGKNGGCEPINLRIFFFNFSNIF